MPKYIPAIILAIAAFLLLLPWINRPFTGHHDFTGAFDSQMARNYLRYGLITTRLGQVTNFGEASSPSEFTYHTHHPPGVPLMLAGAYALFGEHEWLGRMVPVLFALGSVFLFFLLTSDVTNIVTGFISTALMISTSLFIYGSILPVYEAPALFLILLQYYGFRKFSKTGKKKYHAVVLLAAIVGYITTWATYFAIPILLFTELLQKRKKYMPLLISMVIISLLFFGLHILHTKWLTGQFFGGGLDQIFLKRTGFASESDPRYAYTTGKYVLTILKRLKDFYGIPLLGLGTIGFIFVFFKRMSRKLAMLLFLTAISLPVFFRNYVFVHDYILYYFAPLLGLLGGIGISSLSKFLPHRDRFLFLSISVFLLIAINTVFTKTMWHDLWTSKEWYAASPIIGERLRRTTKPGQSILLINELFREQETQLAYYADRPVSFPSSGQEDNPYVIVNVAANFQFPPEYKERLLRAYRLEVERGVEYYYRK